MGYKGSYETFDNRFIWMRCYDCQVSVSKANWEAHLKKHRPRPHEEAMTPTEVMEILGKTKGELNHIVRTGRMEVIRHPGKKRIWILRDVVVAYAKKEMESGNLRMMQVVTSGGKKKHG